MNRLLNAAIAGFVATAPMTMAMRRLHRHLPQREQYPLPPREIMQQIARPGSEARARRWTLIGHFGYGSFSGMAMAALVPDMRIEKGAAFGVVVWLASYLGWLPALGILQPANRHPARRNTAMLLAHLVWGGATALIARELDAAGQSAFASGPLADSRVATQKGG